MKKSWAEKENDVILRFIFIFIGLILISAVVFLMDYSSGKPIDISNIIILSSFTGFLIILFTIVMIYIRKKKLKERERREIYLRIPENERYRNVLEETDRVINESRRQWVRTPPNYKPEIIQRRKTNIKNFFGEISNEKCAICKLALRKKQRIYQCESCLSLFHEKHLEEWLKNNVNCPVCGVIMLV